MGRVDIKDHVTIAQFNKPRQSMEEKQERLTQDLHNLMTEMMIEKIVMEDRGRRR